MTDASIQVEEVVVRDGPRGHDLGKRVVDEHDVDGPSWYGWGETHSEAFEHVRSVADPRDYQPGRHLATIYFDVVEKTYRINWEVVLGPRQRIEDYRRRQEILPRSKP